MSKLTTEEMLEKIRASRNVLMGKSHWWKHYKGGIYKIEDLVIGTETGEVDVIYSRVDGPGFDCMAEREIKFARPLVEWFDSVDVEHHDVGIVPTQRFIPVRPKLQTMYMEVYG